MSINILILFVRRQKIMFVFRFLLSELLFLASVLAFYSLSRYSPSDGFLLKKFINSNKMPYFRDFYFYDFRFKRDEVHEMEKVCGWDFKAETSKNLSHLSYLQRCHVFLFLLSEMKLLILASVLASVLASILC